MESIDSMTTMNHQETRERRRRWSNSSSWFFSRRSVVVVILLSTTTTKSRHVLQAVEAYHAGPSVPDNKNRLKWKNRLGPFYNHPARRLPNHHLKASDGEEESSLDQQQNFQNPRVSGTKKSSLSLFTYFGFQTGFPNSLIFLSLSTFLAFKYTIPTGTILFSIFYPIYIGVINRFRFQRNALALHKPVLPLLHTGRGPWFPRYVTFFGLLGLLLPLLYIGLAPSSAFAQAAAPHLYLVSCQLILERMVSGVSTIHPLSRCLVPIGFNTFRLWSLWEWTQQSLHLLNEANSHAPLLLIDSVRLSSSVLGWSMLGVILSISNLITWSYNLFVFLVLRMLPQYFDPVEFPTSSAVEWKFGNLIPVVVSKRESS